MSATITVKGMGKISVKPDLIVLSLSVEARNTNYQAAMDTAAQQLSQLRAAIASVGFESDALKTTDFNVQTEYKNVQDEKGIYVNRFVGYLCSHRFSLSFDFDTQKLSDVLAALSNCAANPQFSVSFTAKEPSAVNAQLLRSATENAREKAEILCAASGNALGKLVSIDYSWSEHDLYAPVNYRMMSASADCCKASIDITPDDIQASDTVTFVWEID